MERREESDEYCIKSILFLIWTCLCILPGWMLSFLACWRPCCEPVYNKCCKKPTTIAFMVTVVHLYTTVSNLVFYVDSDHDISKMESGYEKTAARQWNSFLIALVALEQLVFASFLLLICFYSMGRTNLWCLVLTCLILDAVVLQIFVDYTAYEVYTLVQG